jgi:hypothetical protein
VEGWYEPRPSLARSGYGGRGSDGGLVRAATLAGAFGLRWAWEWWRVGTSRVPRWRVRATVGVGVVEGWYEPRPSLARSGYGGRGRGGGMVRAASLAGAFGLRWAWAWWRVGTSRVPRWRVRATVGVGVMEGWYEPRPSLARSGYGGRGRGGGLVRAASLAGAFGLRWAWAWWRVGTSRVPRWRVRATVVLKPMSCGYVPVGA